MEKTLPSSDSIYYHNSYLELKIENVFPKVCEIRCEDNMANFSSDYTTSYYHIADVLNMSYDQSVQYCAGKNCENFTCPKDFIKCPKSYCISNTYIGDRVKDCPYGEDELNLEEHSCAADFTFISREVCIDVFNWVNNNWILPFSENITFECNPPCPKDFVCVSTALHIEDGVTAFGQICILSNHKSIRRSIRNLSKNIKKRKEDMSIARKLAFVALTDFMCWFPVGILGFLSLKGHIFDREVYAWIAVFVMPINSALNPIIYTIPSIYQKYSSKKAG
ncbi:G-protein coupled receptor GRL101 [Biomphalaria glabrata]|nr:G-protein coupled receptor GRL101 [Biomphalaria glabrata]